MSEEQTPAFDAVRELRLRASAEKWRQAARDQIDAYEKIIGESLKNFDDGTDVDSDILNAVKGMTGMVASSNMLIGLRISVLTDIVLSLVPETARAATQAVIEKFDEVSREEVAKMLERLPIE